MKHTSTPAPSEFAGNMKVPSSITEEFLATLQRFGVVEASVFGSVVRGEERPGSDIDLYVRFGDPVTLFRQIELASELERVCGRSVDVLTAIHPAFKPYILPTLVRLPI